MCYEMVQSGYDEETCGGPALLCQLGPFKFDGVKNGNSKHQGINSEPTGGLSMLTQVPLLNATFKDTSVTAEYCCNTSMNDMAKNNTFTMVLFQKISMPDAQEQNLLKKLAELMSATQSIKEPEPVSRELCNAAAGNADDFLPQRVQAVLHTSVPSQFVFYT